MNRLIQEDMENRIAKLKEQEIVSNEENLKTKKTEIEQECVSFYLNFIHAKEKELFCLFCLDC